jgi:hypothetical protein
LLEEKLSFPPDVSDLLLSGSDLERERERERERESLRRGKESLGELKSGSTHIALAVWYKPLAST